MKETGILVSCSDYHIFLKLKMTRRQAMDHYLSVIRDCLEEGISPRCHLEDITRADIYGYVVPFCMELMKLMEEYQIPVAGKNVVIIGRSNLVGRPLAALMINADATVTVAHSKTKELSSVASQADILVVATGRAEMVDETYIKEGATVIDVGINRLANGKLVGDVKQASAETKAAYLTPVPGGVGPMTIAMLMQQTLELAEKSNN